MMGSFCQSRYPTAHWHLFLLLCSISTHRECHKFCEWIHFSKFILNKYTKQHKQNISQGNPVLFIKCYKCYKYIVYMLNVFIYTECNYNIYGHIFRTFLFIICVLIFLE